ncbi:MAG: hypothetical protein IEMM0008_1573 [bacterium]|nr:MAG: hypothetical protein IEMM0008_1573 [bacterium]
MKNTKKIYFNITILIPFILSILWVSIYGTGIYFRDEWYLADSFKQLYDLDLSALWDQHNEHRIVLTKLILYLNYVLGFDTLFIMYLNQFIHLITSFFLAIGIISEMKLSNKLISKSFISLFIFILFAFLFSPTQSDNILWSFQNQWYLCLMGTVLSIIGVHKLKYSWTLPGILISYLSLASWVAIIPVYIIYFIFLYFNLKDSYKNKVIIFILSHLALFIGLLILYLWDLNKTVGLGEILLFLKNPMTFIGYVLAFLGSPMAWSLWSAQVFGVIFLVCFVYLAYINFKQRQLSMGLLLIIWVLAVASLIGLGRLGYGELQALSSRYSTFVLPGWAVICIYIIYLTRSLGKYKTYSIRIVVLAVLLMTYAKGLLLLGDDLRIKKKGLKCYQELVLKKKQGDRNCLKILDKSIANLLSSTETLEKLYGIPSSWKTPYKPSILQKYIRVDLLLEEIIDWIGIEKLYKWDVEGDRGKGRQKH